VPLWPLVKMLTLSHREHSVFASITLFIAVQQISIINVVKRD